MPCTVRTYRQTLAIKTLLSDCCLYLIENVSRTAQLIGTIYKDNKKLYVFRRISRGGLTYPSNEVLNMVRKTTNIFQKHHGFSLKRVDVIRDVVKKVMSTNNNFDEIIVKKIVRVLTFSR